MEERLIFFTQQEYTQVLDRQNARTRKLSQKEYEQILIDRGVRPGQAKMAAYKYRHHEKSRFATRKGSQEEYEKLLNDFCAAGKPFIDSVRCLESLGFSFGQANSAAHKYRGKKGLIGKRRWEV